MSLSALDPSISIGMSLTYILGSSLQGLLDIISIPVGIFVLNQNGYAETTCSTVRNEFDIVEPVSPSSLKPSSNSGREQIGWVLGPSSLTTPGFTSPIVLRGTGISTVQAGSNLFQSK